jgi:hypothetical protein
MRKQRVTVLLPYDLVQRARHLVRHRPTHYSLVGFFTKGLAREVTKVERKEQVHWTKGHFRLPSGRRKKVRHGLQPRRSSRV